VRQERYTRRRRQSPGLVSKSDWRTTATTIAGIVSVLLVAAGLFYTSDANRKQQQLGLDQQKLALQGQVADRFTAAIDQLGQEDQKTQDKLSIRLGGIYALQRLMIDSPPDEQAVIQVLCAFVRTHAPRPDPRPKTVPRSPADVRAAVSVLGYRPHPDRYALDLADTLLGLDHADLSGADLRDTDLSGADLRLTNLRNANLGTADLRNADLRGADLYGLDLRGAWLSGVNLNSADLRSTALGVPEFIERTGYLDGPDLHGANLYDAELYGLDLVGANFNSANLYSADLSNTELNGADLRRTNLRKASLVDADLDDADLSDTYLADTFGLTTRQVARTSMNKETTLPAGIRRPTPSPTR
jgi:hypothetical protein